MPTLQHDFRCCKNDAATPTQFYAAENAITGALDANTDILRVRVALYQGSGAVELTTLRLQYSTDDTNWTELGSGNHWNWANGAGTDGNAVASRILSSTGQNGIYLESSRSGGTLTFLNYYEFDFAVSPTATVSASTAYYFRVVSTATPTVLELGSGHVHPKITTAAAAGTTHALAGEIALNLSTEAALTLLPGPTTHALAGEIALPLAAGGDATLIPAPTVHALAGEIALPLSPRILDRWLRMTVTGAGDKAINKAELPSIDDTGGYPVRFRVRPQDTSGCGVNQGLCVAVHASGRKYLAWFREDGVQIDGLPQVDFAINKSEGVRGTFYCRAGVCSLSLDGAGVVQEGNAAGPSALEQVSFGNYYETE